MIIVPRTHPMRLRCLWPEFLVMGSGSQGLSSTMSFGALVGSEETIAGSCSGPIPDIHQPTANGGNIRGGIIALHGTRNRENANGNMGTGSV
jgi:hypothetical protein